MCNTIPLEEMIDHLGGKLYNPLMLRPSNWKSNGIDHFPAQILADLGEEVDGRHRQLSDERVRYRRALCADA